MNTPETRANIPHAPDYARDARGINWLAHEAWDHLWPWSRAGFARSRVVGAVSAALALLVTVVWGLAASGHLRAGALIGWWLAWSVIEVAARLQSKPYVKEGPWWGRQYRRATRMDMLCYVLFKNLLIGALLFLGLKAAGLLDL